MRIGMFGYRPPGFYACTFNELELRNKLGPEIIHIDLSDILVETERIPHQEVQAVIKDLNNRFKIEGPPQEDLINTSKLYLSVRKIIEKERLSCTAIKCWPELKDYHNMGACFTLSRLNDEGIMSACEADIHGVITMFILHTLTGKTIYFTDILSTNDEKNTFLMWHCGSGPTTLAEDPSKVKVCNFSIEGLGRGITTEFPIKPGYVTIARLSTLKNNYRMFISGGEALKTKMVMRGNPLEIKLDNNMWEVLGKITAEGIEHHYAIVHEDVKEELVDLCKRLKIETILA
jgi:L-fucose isomerase-like protein